MKDENCDVVLAGDPRQLGPIIYSGIAREHKYDVPVMERYQDRLTIVQLHESHRCQQSIFDLYRENFYSDVPLHFVRHLLDGARVDDVPLECRRH